MSEKAIALVNLPHDAEYILREPNNVGEMELEINEGYERTKVRFRNVGKRNQNAAIQFTYEQHNRKTNGTKFASFSIPYEMANLFLKHLSMPD